MKRYIHKTYEHSRNNFLYLFASILILGSASFNNVRAEFDTAYARILQNKLNTVKTQYGLVGISAAVSSPRLGTWLGQAGISHPGVNITHDIVFDIGSITKNFMSALALQLVQGDSLSLNDTIGKFLPQYNNVNGKVTIKQILNHTSGLYNFTDNPSFNNAINSNLSRVWTLDEVLTSYVLAPYFQPGVSWHYSNTNYIILAIIIRQITQRDLGELMSERFFSPLGMDSTYFEFKDTVNVPFVHGWSMGGGGQLVDISGIPRTAFITSTLGAGGVITRPEDIVKWPRALYTGQIISPAILTQMLEFTNASISGANGYGLGTMRYNVGGKTCWGHGGNSFGHSCILMYYPADSICMTLMMNRDINTGPIGIDFMNTVFANYPIGILSQTGTVPSDYSLKQNYQNPFNPETKIKFSIPSGNNSRLTVMSVYNTAGELVNTLVNEYLGGGEYEVSFNASDLPSGVYFYTIESGNFRESKKMILVK